MKAYVLIEIRSGGVDEAIRRFRDIAGVTEAHATFGPFDAVVVVEADSVDALGRLVNLEIQTVPAVIKTLTCLASDAGPR